MNATRSLLPALLLAVCPIGLLAADAPNPATAHERTWKPTAAILGGMRLPPEALQLITLRIAGPACEVTVRGRQGAGPRHLHAGPHDDAKADITD